MDMIEVGERGREWTERKNRSQIMVRVHNF